MTDLDPVVMHFAVPLGPADAFELFTTELDTWWPFTGHSCTDDQNAKVRFDPRAHGEVSESSADGSRRFVWGTISEWNPPDGFSMSWHPGQPPEQATRVSVSFVQTPNGCAITLVHDGWAARGEAGALARGRYAKGWVGVTENYVKSAELRG